MYKGRKEKVKTLIFTDEIEYDICFLKAKESADKVLESLSLAMLLDTLYKNLLLCSRSILLSNKSSLKFHGLK